MLLAQSACGTQLIMKQAQMPGHWEVLPRSSLIRWDEKLSEYIQKLQKTNKPVLLVGDMNCAHQEIDIKNPKTNLKSAGFTPVRFCLFGCSPCAQCPLCAALPWHLCFFSCCYVNVQRVITHDQHCVLGPRGRAGRDAQHETTCKSCVHRKSVRALGPAT